MVQYEAKGIGAADEGLQTLLHELYNKVNIFLFKHLKILQDMGLLDAEKLALNCLKQVMEEKVIFFTHRI